MKIRNFRNLIFLVSVIAMISSCGYEAESKTDIQKDGVSSDGISPEDDNQTITNQKIAPVAIEKMEIGDEAKNELKKRVSNSPFKALGCCDSEENRFNECCCQEVLNKYKELVKENKVGDLNLTDQILIDCKKGDLRLEFEKVDYGNTEKYGDI